MFSAGQLGYIDNQSDLIYFKSTVSLMMELLHWQESVNLALN